MIQPEKLSLYIHVPFCRHKCRYCDFYSIQYNNRCAADYIAALLQEWRLVQEIYQCDDMPIQSIFFGGGTPSILTIEQWQAACAGILTSCRLTPDYEWTIECNPDSFTEEKAAAWRQSGVNRLTLGVQSLYDRELSLLGRIHNAQQALTILRHSLLHTFSSVGVDIMYGIPGQTVQSLSKTFDQLLTLPVVSHCSAYELTLAVHTPFYRHRAILPLPSENTSMAMTRLVLLKTKNHGFEQYEVSNFAKPGFACRHNMAYWDLSPYIGLGPGAHSFIHGQRFENVNDISKYCNAIAHNRLPIAFSEETTPKMREREIIFLRLRTREGLDEDWFYDQIGTPFQNAYRRNKLDTYVKRGLLEYHPPLWRCTDDGMYVVDSLARDLIP